MALLSAMLYNDLGSGVHRRSNKKLGGGLVAVLVFWCFIERGRFFLQIFSF